MIEKPSDSNSKKKRSIVRRILKFLAIIFLVVSLLLIIAVAALDHYLQSNKTKIFEQLPILNHGSISFEEAEISVYKNFPSATVSLHNLMVKDSLFQNHQIPFLNVGELRAGLSLKKLWEEEVELKSIELYDGQLNFHTDSSEYKLFEALLPKPSKNSGFKKNNLLKDFKFRTDKLNISLTNVFIRLTNVNKRLSIQGTVNQIFTQLLIDKNDFLVDVKNMEIDLKEMTFDKEKGTFLKDSKLVGKPVIHINKNVLTFDPFELQINDELFTFNGVYDTKKKTQSRLFLENKNTRWHKIAPLLTDSIKLVISPYFIQNPFYTKTIIKGHFIRGQPLTVDINFLLEKNEAKVFDYELNPIDLKGRFVTRYFDDRFNESKSRKGFTLEIHKLTTKTEGFQLQTQNGRISAPRKTPPTLESNVKVHGNAENISRILSSNQFFFHNGFFDLTAQINSPINNFERLMVASDATLTLKDIDVYYKPADVVFPFKRLFLSKKSGDADFELLSSTPVEDHNFQVAGLLKNLPALLVNLKNQRVSSQADLVATKLDWRDFIDWFGNKDNLKAERAIEVIEAEREKKKSMKQTIRGIQHKFQPQISLSIDTLSYYNLLQIDNFLTKVYFEDENNLVLEKTSFGYGKGTVSFKARLDISDSLQTPFEFELLTEKLNLERLLPPLDYLNIKLLANLEKLPDNLNLSIKHQGIIDDHTGLIPNTSTGEIYFDINEGELLAGKITYQPELHVSRDSIKNKAFTKAKVLLEGDPSVFNNFLKTDQFFFSKGRFYFIFDYSDSHASLEHVLNDSNASLKILDSNVFYKPTKVDFPLKYIDLFLNSGEAEFDLLIQSDSLKRQLELKGLIENISELIIGNTGKSIKTVVDAKSPKIIWNHFLQLFVPKPIEPIQQLTKKEKLDNVKVTINGFFNHFNPTISAEIDTLILTEKFTVNNFKAGVYITDANILILDKVAFDFYDGSLSANGQFNFNAPGHIPFISNFQTNDFDVEKLLKSLNYLNLPSLKNIEKLSGLITMDLDLAGLIDENGEGFVLPSLKGALDVKLKDVELRGMATLDTLARKIRMKKRFADIRFAPIENRFTIDGQHIEIPLMEIQSNAINFFMEGTLSYADQTDIWITVPLDNLKKEDRTIVPPKRGYAAVKNKVYIEVTTDEAGDNKFKFRMSKRKFYKKRGIKSQYRKDKRKYKAIRKEQKKQKKD